MEEKHLTLPPLSRSGKLSTLYTLILKSNLDFEIRVNGDVAKAGNLIDDPTLLNPTLTPPKEVIDINDVQPEDWDDVEFIPDPEITEKPADYDEKFYFHHIEDPNAVKPDTWEESEVELIVDPNSERPNDWDDEEDGEWEGPLIKNPKCISNGCGKWTPPKIPNPNYIGPWVQPVIPNPNYQGEWVPRMIPNKYYYEDLTPSNLKLIGGIGFELWSMDNDLMFDNIYLGHSVEEAQLIGNETFITKERLERASFEANRPKAKNEPSPPPKNFEDLLRDDDESRLTQFIVFLKHYLLTKYLDVKDFIDEFRDNPIETIVNNPLKFVGYCVGFVFIFTFSFGMISVFLFLLSGGVDHPDKSSNLPKNIEEISKEEEANGALTSGFESSLSEPSKRK